MGREDNTATATAAPVETAGYPQTYSYNPTNTMGNEYSYNPTHTYTQPVMGYPAAPPGMFQPAPMPFYGGAYAPASLPIAVEAKRVGIPSDMYKGFFGACIFGICGILCAVCFCWNLYGRSGAFYGCAVYGILNALYMLVIIILYAAGEMGCEDNEWGECPRYPFISWIVEGVLGLCFALMCLWMGRKKKVEADRRSVALAEMESRSPVVYPPPLHGSPLMPQHGLNTGGAVMGVPIIGRVFGGRH